MLGGNGFRLRQGFRLRRKHLYGAKAPPHRVGPHVLLSSILFRCSKTKGHPLGCPFVLGSVTQRAPPPLTSNARRKWIPPAQFSAASGGSEFTPRSRRRPEGRFCPPAAPQLFTNTAYIGAKSALLRRFFADFADRRAAVFQRSGRREVVPPLRAERSHRSCEQDNIQYIDRKRHYTILFCRDPQTAAAVGVEKSEALALRRTSQKARDILLRPQCRCRPGRPSGRCFEAAEPRSTGEKDRRRLPLRSRSGAGTVISTKMGGAVWLKRKKYSRDRKRS